MLSPNWILTSLVLLSSLALLGGCGRRLSNREEQMLLEISTLQNEVADQKAQITELSAADPTKTSPDILDLGEHLSRFDMNDLAIGKLKFTEAKGIRPGQWISEPLDGDARVELRVNSDKIVQQVKVVLPKPVPDDEDKKKALLELAARCVTAVGSSEIKFGQVHRMIETVWGEDKLYADGLSVVKRGAKATCEVRHDFRTGRILVDLYPSQPIQHEVIEN